MQAFAGAIATTVHLHSTHTVTLGSASLKWNSAASVAVGNWWSDRALQTAYPSPQAKLDLYQIHYYDWMHNDQWGYDPCRKDTTYWQLDKPTIIGELPATGGQYYTPDSFMSISYHNNFLGSVFWSYNADFDWHQAINGWNNFYKNYTAQVDYQSLVAWLKELRK